MSELIAIREQHDRIMAERYREKVKRYRKQLKELDRAHRLVLHEYQTQRRNYNHVVAQLEHARQRLRQLDQYTLARLRRESQTEIL